MSILDKLSTNECPCKNKTKYDEPCIDDDKIITKIYDYLESSSKSKSQGDFDFEEDLPTGNSKKSKAIRKAAKQLGCKSELCVLRYILPNDEYLKSLKKFKLVGPRNNTKWLSNKDIDNTLEYWANEHNYFYNYIYSMIDFEKYGGPMHLIKPHDVLHNTKYPQYINDGKEKKIIYRSNTCAGGVMNTDHHKGPGKHWVAFFIDGRNKNNITLEYFNSSGNPPPKEVVKWMNESKEKGLKPIIVTNLQHQKYDTECGMYSLCYIRSRIENIPHTHFRDNYIPDSDMEKYRKHVFASAD